MHYFLAKTDPETYSLDDLEREERTAWDGVTNAQAVRAIREMRPGDRVFVYHSGGVSGVVGLATVRSEPRDDPKNPKSAVVDLEFSGRAGAAHFAGRNQAVEAIRRLGAGAPGPSLDHGGAGEFRGVDEEAVSGREDLTAGRHRPGRAGGAQQSGRQSSFGARPSARSAIISRIVARNAGCTPTVAARERFTPNSRHNSAASVSRS